MIMVTKISKWHDTDDSVDRISELPEFILHQILSFLTTEEACRASLLSKTWYEAWASIPVLDFHPQYFKKEFPGHTMVYGESYDEETLACFVGFIDKTMCRYSEQKYSIRKFQLRFPKVDEKLQPLLDKWIEIAVQNQVEEMTVEILLLESPGYILPDVVFSSKTLRVLDCRKVKMPYYPIMNLDSLERLTLHSATVDECMLQRIVSFSRLIELELRYCSAFKDFWIPWMREMPETARMGSSNGQGSVLRTFEYENGFDVVWPFKMNLDALRNLNKLELTNADITDVIVSELAYGLASLESLVLSGCLMLENIEVSSTSLKEFYIVECHELEKATIDAPNLLSFWYNGRPGPYLSVINSQELCDTHYYVYVESLSTEWFVNVNKFLLSSNIFRVLEINLPVSTPQFELQEDLLRKTATGLPYKLKEMILHCTWEWMLTDSFVLAFLDGLFWCCHPDVLSIPTSLHNKTVELILTALKDKVKCWKHPLKAIDVEGVDSSYLLSCTDEQLVVSFRLSW